MLFAEGLKSICCLPLLNRGRTVGVLTVANRERAFSMDDMDLLRQVANQVAIAVDNALAFREIAELKEKLTEEKSYLEDEIRTILNFDEIIGESTGLREVLQHVQTVAPTEAAVLILGETGTGKELIARAIHRLSRRSNGSMVKINCSAIPTGLLESELFGHEKGAFTGLSLRKPAGWNWQIKERYFWTKLETFRWNYNPNCYAFSRKASSKGWGALERFMWMCD